MPLYRDPQSPYWWVRFSIGGVKIRRSSQTTDRTAAEEFETKLRADLWRQIKLGERPRYTWKQAVEKFNREHEGREREREAERLTWFAEYLDDVPLAEIGRELIEKLRAVKAAETSPATANRYMALLRAILHLAAEDWDWIERAPKVPMYRQEKAEPRFITHAQARRLLGKLGPHPHLRDLAEFSLETGLRMRNATGLTWSQVDLRRKQLMVPAAWAKAGETIAIPLSPRAVQIIRARRGAHHEHVFTFRRGPKGRELPLEDANGAIFKAAARAAGVPWLRWHDLRHTWASWHVQRGTPLHVLKELGGWKSLAMVQRYAYLSTVHLREFVDRKRAERK